MEAKNIVSKKTNIIIASVFANTPPLIKRDTMRGSINVKAYVIYSQNIGYRTPNAPAANPPIININNASCCAVRYGDNNHNPTPHEMAFSIAKMENSITYFLGCRECASFGEFIGILIVETVKMAAIQIINLPNGTVEESIKNVMAPNVKCTNGVVFPSLVRFSERSRSYFVFKITLLIFNLFYPP